MQSTRSTVCSQVYIPVVDLTVVFHAGEILIVHTVVLLTYFSVYGIVNKVHRKLNSVVLVTHFCSSDCRCFDTKCH